MIYGQAACLLGYFQEQLITNPSFQYAVQLDNVEYITNIFWVDARIIAEIGAIMVENIVSLVIL